MKAVDDDYLYVMFFFIRTMKHYGLRLICEYKSVYHLLIDKCWNHKKKKTLELRTFCILKAKLNISQELIFVDSVVSNPNYICVPSRNQLKTYQQISWNPRSLWCDLQGFIISSRHCFCYWKWFIFWFHC